MTEEKKESFDSEPTILNEENKEATEMKERNESAKRMDKSNSDLTRVNENYEDSEPTRLNEEHEEATGLEKRKEEAIRMNEGNIDITRLNDSRKEQLNESHEEPTRMDESHEESAILNGNQEEPTSVDQNQDGADETEDMNTPGAESKEENNLKDNKKNKLITRFPTSRIKQIMKTDLECTLINPDAVYLVSKATEMFIQLLGKQAYRFTSNAKRKTVTKRDVDAAIDSISYLFFLEGAMD